MGRTKRHKSDLRIENIIGHAARVTVEYHQESESKGRFCLAASEEEDVE